jgi:hypothetical protein
MLQESKVRPEFLQRVQLLSFKAGVEAVSGTKQAKVFVESEPLHGLEDEVGYLHVGRIHVLYQERTQPVQHFGTDDDRSV